MHTTITVVARSATLSKVEAGRTVTVAHDGLAQVIRSVHTLFDSDAIVGFATGAREIALGGEADARPTGRNVRAEESAEISAAASGALARAGAYGIVTAEAAET